MAPISRCVTDEPRPRFLPVLQGSLIVPVSQGQSLSSLVANCSSLSSGLLRLPYKYYLPP